MIKILSLKDAEKCSNLHAVCFGDKKWSSHDFDVFFDNHLITLMGYWHNNYLIGLIVFTIIDTEAEIYTLCTHPDYRQQKIASQLISATKHKCQNKSVTNLFLEVSINNISAIECYKKNGFDILTTRKNYYTENTQPVDALIMCIVS